MISHPSTNPSKSNKYLRISTANMLGRNASQPTGFYLRHCWHNVFWLHLFALYWRGRWISHYSEITVLWISVQVSVEYSQITKIIESNLSLKTTRQNLTTVARISKKPSLIRSPPGWYRNGTPAFVSNVTSFFRPFWSKINIQTTVSQLFGGLFQPPDHQWLIRKRLLSSRGVSASAPILAVRLCPNF